MRRENEEEDEDEGDHDDSYVISAKRLFPEEMLVRRMECSAFANCNVEP